jgi:hypothetical protein
MGTFNHVALMQDINESLGSLRKSQPEAIQGFGQLARASMAEGVISAKHKELMALAIGITQHCSGCIAFHVKALHRPWPDHLRGGAYPVPRCRLRETARAWAAAGQVGVPVCIRAQHRDAIRTGQRQQL